MTSAILGIKSKLFPGAHTALPISLALQIMIPLLSQVSLLVPRPPPCKPFRQ